ncbi:maleylpyruvate isomerase family mycothiol-dependent enzyme [Kribbella sp. NPDC051770]|uniref:maleylpyruvate isomerase family mycothiol-dependent enzyme n=1 Tax=Kribbella sp. NPDC051770 TaxID=3155413 RepID=UPI00341E2248
MTLSPERATFYLDCLRADAARLAEVARLGLAAEVPPCPGWTVDSVVRHTAQVYLHKVEILRLGKRPEPWPPNLDDREPFALYDEAFATLLTALDKAGTSSETWTFSPWDSTSGFWYRRMALETAVHRVDAELAHDVATPVDRELALDGIDEVLTLMLGGPWWAEGDTSSPVDATVRVTADGHSWTIALNATSAEVTRDTDAEVAAEIYGDPTAVLLWLWGRVETSAVQTVGDDEAVKAFRSRVAECTT